MPQQFGPRDLKEVPYLVVYKIIFIISVVVKVYIEYEHALMNCSNNETLFDFKLTILTEKSLVIKKFWF